MSTFVLMYFFVLLYFFVRKWLRAVKIYLHAKFRASSSKIERVMLNFVFCAAAPTPAQPVTNLPVELCASRQLIKPLSPLHWIKIVSVTYALDKYSFCYFHLGKRKDLDTSAMAKYKPFHLCLNTLIKQRSYQFQP